MLGELLTSQKTVSKRSEESFVFEHWRLFDQMLFRVRSSLKLGKKTNRCIRQAVCGLAVILARSIWLSSPQIKHQSIVHYSCRKKTPHVILACINRDIMSKSQEVIFPLYTALVRPPLRWTSVGHHAGRMLRKQRAKKSKKDSEELGD